MAISTIPCTLEDVNINQYGQGYVKFSDGTMIIMETCSVPLSTRGGKPYYKYGSNNDNWPSNSGGFIDSNIAAVITNNQGEVQHYNYSITNITKTGYTVYMGGPDNDATFWPRIMAIGRWKENAQSVVYSFTGSSNYFQENETDWHIELYSDGSLTINKANTSAFDIFCIGGGGGGGSTSENHSYGGGGGGGYGALATNQALSLNSAYSVTIGQGGEGGKYGNGLNSPGGDGGTTSFGSIVSAAGGKGALGRYGSTNAGGIGGNNGGAGGQPGVDGSYGSIATKYFQESTGQDYAGGGGGGGHFGSNGGTGYAGGGNGGYSSTNHQNGLPGTANTGGGGGGASEYNGNHNGGNGGSGIIIIRNHR